MTQETKAGTTAPRRERPPLSEKGALILTKATAIIKQTGSFDLPMRQLAAESQVSLRTPYEIFGSKAGLIRAVLANEMNDFRRRARELPVTDPLTTILERIDLSVRFYGGEQAFYRGLFKGAELFADGDAGQPFPEVQQAFSVLIARAQEAGILVAHASPALLGEVVTHMFLWAFRAWAWGSGDIAATTPQIKFAVATLLAGAATEGHAPMLRAIAAEQQGLIVAG